MPSLLTRNRRGRGGGRLYLYHDGLYFYIKIAYIYTTVYFTLQFLVFCKKFYLKILEHHSSDQKHVSLKCWATNITLILEPDNIDPDNCWPKKVWTLKWNKYLSIHKLGTANVGLHIYIFLVDLGEARGCSTNTSVIN